MTFGFLNRIFPCKWANNPTFILLLDQKSYNPFLDDEDGEATHEDEQSIGQVDSGDERLQNDLNDSFGGIDHGEDTTIATTDAMLHV